MANFFSPSPVRILLVSSVFAEADLLARSVADGVLALVYDPAAGLSALAAQVEMLAAGRPVASIGMAAHGSAAGFALTADAWVGGDFDAASAEQRAFWGRLSSLLAPEGRIDFLACDFAASAEGRLYLAALESNFGVNFAASTNRTGNVALGGDWTLETDGVDAAAAYFAPASLAGVAGVLSASTPSPSQPIVCVSLSAADEAANDHCEAPVVSGNGRFVVFCSKASNLVPGDTNNTEDVFRKDILTGEIIRISVNSSGEQQLGNTGFPNDNGLTVSTDGNIVGFRSYAPNLVAGDDNGNDDFFARDVRKGVTTRINCAPDGTQLIKEAHFTTNDFLVSGDGRYMAFASYDYSFTGEGAGVLNPYHDFDLNIPFFDHCNDIFIKDLSSNSVRRLHLYESMRSAGIELQSISEDGKYILCSSNKGLCRVDTVTGNWIVVLGPEDAHANGAISGDGRYIAFRSTSSSLVANDTNGNADVFLKDMQTGVVSRVNTTSAGGQTSGNLAPSVEISADGRYVIFTSDAGGLVASDTSYPSYDVFVKDVTTGAVVRVSEGATGNQANGSPSTIDMHASSISANGRYVAFQSTATNLTPGAATTNYYDIFLRDLFPNTPTTTLNTAPTATNLTQNKTVASGAAQLDLDDIVVTDPDSGDVITARLTLAGAATGSLSSTAGGSYNAQTGVWTVTGAVSEVNAALAALSFIPAGGFTQAQITTHIEDAAVAGPTDGSITVAARSNTAPEFLPGEYRLVSTSSYGVQGNGDSSDATISANGRYVTFVSAATNLAPGDVNNATDVFLKDTYTGNLTPVSTASHSSTFGNGASSAPIISADGRWVAFVSESTNLVPGDVNGKKDLFLKSPLLTGETKLASVYADGRQTDFDSAKPLAIADDGHSVIFLTTDNNYWYKNFITGDLVKINEQPGVGQFSISSPDLSGNGRYVAFATTAKLTAGDIDSQTDIYVKDMQTGSVVLASCPAGGGSLGQYDVHNFDLSTQGNFVAFAVGSDSNDDTIYIKDLKTQELHEVFFNKRGPGGFLNDIELSPDNKSLSFAYQYWGYGGATWNNGVQTGMYKFYKNFSYNTINLETSSQDVLYQADPILMVTWFDSPPYSLLSSGATSRTGGDWRPLHISSDIAVIAF